MNPGVTKSITKLVRKITGRFIFKKSLPSEFGGIPIYVTSRADIRLLVPGWEGPGGDLMQVTRKYVHPGMTVWDVGANLGILSFCAAAKATASGKVFSVEADPKYAEIQNMTARGLPSSCAPVVPLCAAASDSLSLLSLVVPKNGHARNHLSVVGGNSAESTECTKAVVTVTLDFLREFWGSPGFLKIDVEGAEHMVLKGAESVLSKDRPVIYIEVNEENSQQVTEVLKKHSYGLYSLDSNGNEEEIERCVFNTLAKPLALGAIL